MNRKQYGVFNILFVFSIISLIYTLGFFSNFTSFLGIDDVFYQYVQEVNSILFNFAIATVFIGAIVVTTKMLRHEHYSIFNFVLLILYTSLNAGSALTLFKQIPLIRTHYLKADFDFIMKINKTYEINERVFQYGHVMMVLHILVAVVTLGIIITGIQKSRKRKESLDVN